MGMPFRRASYTNLDERRVCFRGKDVDGVVASTDAQLDGLSVLRSFLRAATVGAAEWVPLLDHRPTANVFHRNSKLT